MESNSCLGISGKTMMPTRSQNGVDVIPDKHVEVLVAQDTPLNTAEFILTPATRMLRRIRTMSASCSSSTQIFCRGAEFPIRIPDADDRDGDEDGDGVGDGDGDCDGESLGRLYNDRQRRYEYYANVPGHLIHQDRSHTI